jgi:hypothetical protein
VDLVLLRLTLARPTSQVHRRKRCNTGRASRGFWRARLGWGNTRGHTSASNASKGQGSGTLR